MEQKDFSNEFIRPSDTESRGEGRPLGAVAAEITSSLKDVLRSELNLAKVELKQSTKGIGSHAAQIGIFGVIAAIGLLPFMAFLIIGLGRIFNDNYWLSSLLVAMVCFAVGGGMAYRSFKKIREQDLTFSNTRDTLRNGVSVFDRKLKQVSESAQRRVA